jgi:hypothetical protein
VDASTFENFVRILYLHSLDVQVLIGAFIQDSCAGRPKMPVPNTTWNYLRDLITYSGEGKPKIVTYRLAK